MRRRSSRCLPKPGCNRTSIRSTCTGSTGSHAPGPLPPCRRGQRLCADASYAAQAARPCESGVETAVPICAQRLLDARRALCAVERARHDPQAPEVVIWASDPILAGALEGCGATRQSRAGESSYFRRVRAAAAAPYPRLRKLRASRCNLLIFRELGCHCRANLQDSCKESRQPAMCTASEFAGIVAIPSAARRGKQT